jgi:hypothetical protein
VEGFVQADSIPQREACFLIQLVSAKGLGAIHKVLSKFSFVGVDIFNEKYLARMVRSQEFL